MRRLAQTAGILLLLLSATQASALEIRRVQHDSNRLVKPGTDVVQIRFELDTPAAVELNLYDGRELLMRRIASDGALAAGAHTLTWDGKDAAGKAVPPGAYHYTLVATGADKQAVTHDLSDLTGGEMLDVKNITEDTKKKTISYLLQRPSRVNIRVGLQNSGPLLRTVRDWVPRAAGTHTEHWDGMDSSKVIKLATHPKRDLVIEAFALPDNTLMVGEPKATEQLIRNMSWEAEKRAVTRDIKRPVSRVSRQPLETRGNFAISLGLPQGLKTSEDDLPLVTGRIPVRLNIAEEDRKPALERRFEAAFYVDGTLVFENETGFFPMTWYWDTRGMNPGVHYLTVNVMGYGGNFGMETVKVRIEPNGSQD